MLAHDFILVDKVPDSIRYKNYDKSIMVQISDDFAQENWTNVFGAVNVYVEQWGNLVPGLAYHGTSILTPSMARDLLSRTDAIAVKEKDYDKLVAMLREAIEKEKYIIHFGI